jgi:tRNA threonylcarbamoyladenosine biosynthesis protein TsaE
MKQIVFTLDQIEQIVREQIIPLMQHCSIFTFTGPLGVGKTTIIQEILRQKGVNEVVTSPTFNYVNTYMNAAEEKFFHFDLYRITTLDIFLQAGLDEYFYQEGGMSFIEWPEMIEPLLNDEILMQKICYIELNYDLDDVSKRIMVIA